VCGYAPIVGIPLGWSEICLNVLNTNNMYTILISTALHCCHHVCIITVIVVVVGTLWQWPSASHRCHVVALAMHIPLSLLLCGGSGHLVVVAVTAWWWPCHHGTGHACLDVDVVIIAVRWWPATHVLSSMLLHGGDHAMAVVVAIALWWWQQCR